MRQPSTQGQRDDDLASLTVGQLAERIATRQLSATCLAEALIARIEALDPQIGAFITVTPDHALKRALEADKEIAQGRYRGPLHGIPFAVKDVYETEGIRTTANSRLLLGNIPKQDAAAVSKLYDAGGVLMGKLTTHEFAHGGPSFQSPWPPPRNPWNRDHFTAGSSSGSGAAVAAGFVPVALGSDTGGSIRNPASLCGIAGLKPTNGLVSRHGLLANSPTFDTVGPMTWNVEDCAIVLQALAGHDARDPGSVRARLGDYRAALRGNILGVRIGVVRHFWEEDHPANAEVCASMDEAIRTLRDLGAAVSDVRLRPLQEYCDIKIVLGESELYAIHERELIQRPGAFCDDFLGRALPAILIRGTDVAWALHQRSRVIEEMAAVYAKYDVLVTASTYGPAPKLGAYQTIEWFWKGPSITTPFNVTGGPAISICNGFSTTGLPLGMQVAGPPFNDATVLRVAHAYEQATSWRRSRPRVAQMESRPRVELAAQQPWQESNSDRASIEEADQAIRRAGLILNEAQRKQIINAAPYVRARCDRLRGSGS